MWYDVSEDYFFNEKVISEYTAYLVPNSITDKRIWWGI